MPTRPGPTSDAACRLATVADAARIAHLLRASITGLCAADHGARPETLAAWLDNKTAPNIEAWTRDPGNLMLVATIGEAVAGVACLRLDGQLMLNYVAPAFRFQGVSKALVAEAERRAAALGLVALTLESTRTAHRFYRSLGFADSGPATAWNGLAAQPMTKPLAG